ncbi:ribose-5-phosphate isomerase RpiA [Tropicimonas sp. IMCC34043]|uniref:ribose-5-phosphate isomerase RpiA n=1 Tax=Tropicimonas sp. IMCC34043 TaxID=2248760 RepID=UPI000E228FF9|nr:ribose-5-phosphate isomerase RpiA [Tropicimonas sp. IMCC34043]
MSTELSPIDRAKRNAALRSCDFVEDGMKVGLGTGSTAAWMVRRLGERVRDEGLQITGVPTSTRTGDLAREVGIPVSTLEDVGWLDLTIDGADEFDSEFNLIKGGGGAHLQEKIVATASDRMIVIADAAKDVKALGAFPLPVETIKFGWKCTRALIEEALSGMDVLGRETSLRMAGDQPFVSDEGNFILDLHLRRIGDARQLSLVLNQIPGVVENGLFIDICDVLVIGHGNGAVEIRDIERQAPGLEAADGAEPENIFADTGE